MPAPKVRGQYTELQQIAQAFGTHAEQLQGAVQRIQQAKSTLQGGDWVGKGATAFYREMDGQVLPALQRLVSALQQAGRVTGQMAAVVQQAENDTAALFRLGAANPSGGATGEATTSADAGGDPTAGANGGAATDSTLPGGNTPQTKGPPLIGKAQREGGIIGKAESAAILKKSFGDYTTITGGKVSILGQADFQKAYDKIYGDTPYAWDKDVAPTVGNLEGFAYEGVNYINKDVASVDTMPHEMLHNNTHDKFTNFAEGNINEGATEYLTIKAMKDAGYTPSHSYPDQERVIRDLVKVVGEEKLLNAYFKGDTKALKTAMEANSKGTWAQFKTAMDAEDWVKARALLAKK